MQKVHIQLADDLATISQNKFLVVGEFADDRRFDVFGIEYFFDGIEVLRLDRDDHAFLRFTYPYLGVVKPCVFERHFFKVNFSPEVPTHLTDCAAQAARAAIGYSFVKSRIPGLQQNVEHLLFGDCISNLHRVRENRFVLVCHFAR